MMFAMLSSPMASGEFEGPDVSQFGSDGSGGFGGFGGLGDFGAFGVLFGVGSAVIGLGFVAIVVTIILRSARMAKRGQNPFTMEEDLAYQAMQSRTLAPEKSLEQRLAELDDLRARGVISDEEHRTARTEALRG
ncbi:SHOCT domain-containing protein [Curtobacterium sp. NPDC087082]|uniref:SHOCT domain-containing protein n=1 Tax=Curtobacterium sp. NPDC087082 TaxID=3363966 RepID=UPI0037F6B5F2